MNALKGLVGGMGVLIVLGMTLLVWGLYQKAQNPDFTMFPGVFSNDNQAPAVSNSAEPKSFGTIVLPESRGCRIVTMRPVDGRLYVHMGGREECDRILIIDPATGSILGTLTTSP